MGAYFDRPIIGDKNVKVDKDVRINIHEATEYLQVISYYLYP